MKEIWNKFINSMGMKSTVSKYVWLEIDDCSHRNYDCEKNCPYLNKTLNALKDKLSGGPSNLKIKNTDEKEISYEFNPTPGAYHAVLNKSNDLCRLDISAEKSGIFIGKEATQIEDIMEKTICNIGSIIRSDISNDQEPKNNIISLRKTIRDEIDNNGTSKLVDYVKTIHDEKQLKSDDEEKK